MTVMQAIDRLYNERGVRARELRADGHKIIGYFCCFVPDEILAAFDLVPYRIQGSQSEPIDEADALLEPMACPFARSCFNLALKDRYDFLDGFVAPHSCDTIERMYHIWHSNKPTSFDHLINVPHMLGPSSDAFFRNELKYFISRLEDFTGKKLDESKLRDAIRLYNRRRALLREVYDLRRENPPRVSGTEITKLLVAGMGIPAAEHIGLVSAFIDEVKKRPRPAADGLPRIFLWGNEIDDIAFVSLVEECGAHVVMDDLCTGSRFFWQDVSETGDPLEALARRYLCTHCPRSLKPQAGNRREDLENRFGYIREFADGWKAAGAIFYIVRYCDTCELEGPDLKEYLTDLKLPVLMIEDDYSTSTIGQLRTRIQAFLEMIM
ncbi:MAG: 2-hydroxyacyl-CoA dehydratase family protein [Smithellaceae bacterium]|mgnify:FL=1|nr:2-hydroxyacyl-CoA dehydratase family protein [Smithellaceae bacterium]NLX50937.1 2-hydroxyacyl-CoA dehydratase [Deltaproteobacteria bacterium]